jgi:oligoendopeptidase F
MKTYTQSPWSLSDLFTSHDSPEMDAAFTEQEKIVSEFERLRPRLSSDMPLETFLDFIHRLEAIYEQAGRIRAFASLSSSANTQDQAIQTFMGRVDQAMARVNNRLLFFELWWKELGEAHASRLMDGSGDFRYWLETIRLFKPHTLSESEEKIVNLKNVTGKRAINQIYTTLTNRYTFKLQVNGQPKELTRGELMVYTRHHDPQLRAAAYRELNRVYGEDGDLLGQMYQTLVRDWRTEQVDLRHFVQPISARNLDNDIPDEVVNTLLEVCRENVGLFQRFFRLKARWLGMDRLRRYDLYAPVAQADKRYGFGAAAEMVLDSFRHFDPHVADLARRVYEQRHLDSEVRKGKRSGAFCASVTPRLTPWVHLNYQGRADDVATMAHELGHAIHSMLSGGHSLFTFHSSLPLAETASTFGEMMLVDRLLAEEDDEAVRRALLFQQMDDTYATILRQAYFALFERQAHEMVQQGATVEALAEAYLANLREQFGDALEVSDEFRWDWVSIPHIYYTPFYVYAYAFGQLLVFSLYRQYNVEGDNFKPRYLKILAAGGSASPESILTEAGIDIRKADFWQGGFDVIRGLLDQLESLPIRRNGVSKN